jgi:hypothetical protein
MKAQTSMILLVIVLAIFIGMVLFLLNLANTVKSEEFTSLYANNLLLSVMRTDTGYTDTRCKLVSDLVFCSYFTPDWICGDSGFRCIDLANETIRKNMALFGNETKFMKYLFMVSPQFVALDPSGEVISLDFGDSSLKKSKESFKVYSHPLVLSKTFGNNQYILKMQLIVAKK